MTFCKGLFLKGLRDKLDQGIRIICDQEFECPITARRGKNTNFRHFSGLSGLDTLSHVGGRMNIAREGDIIYRPYSLTPVS